MTKNTQKTKAVIQWPEGHFTIEEMQKMHPDFVPITLRFRVNKAVEAKEIVAIGKVKPAIGRPKIVFAKANPSKQVLDAAVSSGVILLDEPKAAVTVAEVKSEKKASKVVVPVVQQKDASNVAVSST